jgi:alpha-tubulin suppressor-like RCC1 family protein
MPTRFNDTPRVFASVLKGGLQMSRAGMQNAVGESAVAGRRTLRVAVSASVVLATVVGLPAGPVGAEQAGSSVRRVAAGSLDLGWKHSCVVLTTQRVRCWGRGNSGQLGHNSTANIGDGRGKSIKVAGNVPLGGKATALAAGKGHTCALLSTGAVRCWGNNRFGMLGYNSTARVGNGRGESIKAAGDVPLGGRATAITAGAFHTCALLTTRAVRCWGYNGEGQLGHDSTANVGDGIGLSIQAVGDVPLGGRATAISAGYLHTCALLTTGAVRCWGNNDDGQLGHDSTANVGDGIGPSIKTAGDVPLGGRAIAISAGGFHTCALLTTGAVRCWGWGKFGQLGHNSAVNIGDGIGKSIKRAGDVPLGGTAFAIAAGVHHTCAVLTTRAVRCWGEDGFGDLGYNSILDIGDGVGLSIKRAGDVPLGGRAAAITAGLWHTCVLLTTQRVRCWGDGRGGRLGHNRTAPVGDFARRSIIKAGNVPVGAKARTSAP